MIHIHHRVITAIREHIVTEYSLACGNVAVGVYESAGIGIVISALQIIESQICIIVITTVKIWIIYCRSAISAIVV